MVTSVLQTLGLDAKAYMAYLSNEERQELQTQFIGPDKILVLVCSYRAIEPHSDTAEPSFNDRQQPNTKQKAGAELSAALSQDVLKSATDEDYKVYMKRFTTTDHGLKAIDGNPELESLAKASKIPVLGGQEVVDYLWDQCYGQKGLLEDLDPKIPKKASGKKDSKGKTVAYPAVKRMNFFLIENFINHKEKKTLKKKKACDDLDEDDLPDVELPEDTIVGGPVSVDDETAQLRGLPKGKGTNSALTSASATASTTASTNALSSPTTTPSKPVPAQTTNRLKKDLSTTRRKVTMAQDPGEKANAEASETVSVIQRDNVLDRGRKSHSCQAGMKRKSRQKE
ncbi:MAG: hypothetical protein M1821_004240 [Bathelium mastoideum]|nr:MAG: hypothetical protein M1821_004240 [Bathelium mastoideum]